MNKTELLFGKPRKTLAYCTEINGKYATIEKPPQLAILISVFDKDYLCKIISTDGKKYRIEFWGKPAEYVEIHYYSERQILMIK